MRLIAIISFVIVLIVAIVLACLFCFNIFRNTRKCYSVCDCSDSSVYCDKRGLDAIPKIKNETFTELELSGNNITVVDSSIFDQCVNVIWINLSNNKIYEIHGNAFHGLLNLKKLFLTNNNLQILPDELFSEHANSLQVIELSNNRLTTLPVSMEKLTNLKEIYLFGNPLYCGCEMRYFASILRNSRIVKAQAKCESPQEFHNKNLRDLTPCKKKLKNANSLPLIVNKPQDIQITKGDEARFDCQVSDLDNAEIQWSLPFNDEKNVNYYWRNQILIIENIQNKHHDATITCTASNLRGSITASAKINVIKEEKPFFNMRPHNVTVIKGSTVIMTCNALGFPKPQIRWVWNKPPRQEIESNGKYIIRKNKLIIENVTEHETIGHYECHASNSAGSDRTSATITLETEMQSKLFNQCEIGKRRFNETLLDARKLINSVVNETTNINEIQSLLRRPNKAARVLAILNDEREKIIELFNEIDQTCKASAKEFDRSSNAHLSLSSGQLAIFSQAFGCQGSVNSIPCSQRMCFHRKYRSLDGKCNNLKNPNTGSAVSAFHRLLKPEYENNLFTPIGWDTEKVYFGFPKPSARLVSSNLLRANNIIPDPNLSVMVMQWGQFLDHDLDFTPVDPAFSRSGGGLACNDTCINDPPCFPILVPPGDKRIKRPCIGFARSLATCGSGATSLISGFQYREQVNQITSFIDASNVYGSNSEEADNLRNRTFQEGKLRVGIDSKSGKPLLPFNVNGLIDCQKDFGMKHVECFKAGDHRSNENLGLLSMHTIWVREHNRLADELKAINNHWDEDKIYFETRKIVGALMQKITYKDWLPIVLGDGIKKLGIYQGYNDSVNPTISNVFATAAMRFGHTLINPFIYRLDEDFVEIPEKHIPLHKAFFAPLKMLEDGGIDPILRGLFAKGSKTVMPEQPMNSELIEKLFTMAHEIGLDLGALNIQRGRDHGLPSYNTWRQFCGLTKAEIFDDFSLEIPSKELREKMRQVYGHPGNVDIFAGAVLEKKVPTSLVGPTFNCLLANQFRRSRDGDRFYYENPGLFTRKQLQQLNEGSLARIVCDNGDNIKRVQKDIFRLPQSNAGFIDCAKIPKIDLTHWKDCRKPDELLLEDDEAECQETNDLYEKLELCATD